MKVLTENAHRRIRASGLMLLLGGGAAACATEPGPEPEPPPIDHHWGQLTASEPGQGVFVDEGLVLGRCAQGNEYQINVDRTTVRMDLLASRDQAYRMMGGTASIGWRVAFARGNARASFAESMVETANAFSVVVQVQHDAFQRVIDTVATPMMLVDPSSPRFSSVCGDGATGSVTYGGHLVMNIRFSLRSAEQKKSFRAAMSAALGRAGGKVGFSAEMEQLTEEWAGEVALNVSAFQDGGGSESLGGLFNGQGGPTVAADNTVGCTQNQLGACLSLIRDSLIYFNDPATAASLKEKPVPVGFEVVPWVRFNVPVNSRISSGALLARRHLELWWDEALDQLAVLTAERSLGIDRADLYRQVRWNIAALEVASRECTEKLDERPNDAAQDAACQDAAKEDGLRALGFVPLGQVVPPEPPGPTQADWDSVRYHHRFEATSGGDGGQCNGGFIGTEVVKLGQSTTASRVDTDDRPGGCADSYAVEDPAGVLAGLKLQANFFPDGDGGQCGNAGLRDIPIVSGGVAPMFSTPMVYDSDSRPGGCQLIFSMEGRDDIAWDVEFAPDGDGGQCGGAGSYTVDAGHPAQIRIDTDRRPGGCRLRTLLRRK